MSWPLPSHKYANIIASTNFPSKIIKLYEHIFKREILFSLLESYIVPCFLGIPNVKESNHHVPQLTDNQFL